MNDKIEKFFYYLPKSLTENLKIIKKDLEKNGYNLDKIVKSKDSDYTKINYICSWIISRKYSFPSS